MKYLVFAAGLFLVLTGSGCASTSKASTEQADRAKEFSIPDDKGVLYVYRAGRLYAAALQYQVKINGKDAGGSGPGTFFRWELKPGTYTIASMTSESSAVVELDVEAGKDYYVEQINRVGLAQGGRIQLKEVDAKRARSEIKEYKMLVSSYMPE